MSENGFVIRDMSLRQEAKRNTFIQDLDSFLGKETDPFNDILEAVEKAQNNGGFLLEATTDGDARIGAVVVTRMPFEEFQPRFHLAYIATAPEARGKGVGKALLKEVQDRTNNSVSLHVTPRNEKAIGFYEKFGWEVRYLRMIPENA